MEMNGTLAKILKSSSDSETITGSFNHHLKKRLSEDEDAISKINERTIKQLIKGCIGGEVAIDDQREIASLSIFKMILLGEERDTKKTTTTKQSYFVPSKVEQFMTMLRMLAHVTGIIGLQTSAYYVKTKRLYKSFKTIKNQLKSLFVRHGEDCGRYLCLLVHNLTFSLINDIMNDETPTDNHMQLHSLIEQVKVGIVITILPSYKNKKQKSRNGNGNANYNNGNQRDNHHNNNNTNNNRSYGNSNSNGTGMVMDTGMVRITIVETIAIVDQNSLFLKRQKITMNFSEGRPFKTITHAYQKLVTRQSVWEH